VQSCTGVLFTYEIGLDRLGFVIGTLKVAWTCLSKTSSRKGWGQDIAALSNMAEALSFTVQASPELKEQIAPLMEKVVDCALHKSVSPYSKPIAEVGSLGQFCYYLEHLNIILGHHHKVVGAKHRQLSQRISEHLLAETLVP
jgi:hypothetical protein